MHLAFVNNDMRRLRDDAEIAALHRVAIKIDWRDRLLTLTVDDIVVKTVKLNSLNTPLTIHEIE